MLEILASEPETSEIRITIHEGRFHQVKRMFEAVGCKVTYLKRLSMGCLLYTSRGVKDFARVNRNW